MPGWVYFLVFGAVMVATMSKSYGLTKRGSRILGRSAHHVDLITGFHGRINWVDPLKDITMQSPFRSKLDVYDWGIRISQSIAFPHGLAPTWEVRFSEIECIEVVQKNNMRQTGVRIKAQLAGAPLVFWTENAQEVLEVVASMGIIANRSTTTLTGREIK